MSLSSIVLYIIFAAALAVAVDVAAAFFAKDIPGLLLCLVFLGCAVLLGFWQPRLLHVLLVCLILLVVSVLAVAYILRLFRKNGPYHTCEHSKEQLFAGKKVLVLVPHEDDEILVAGGVIEEYLKYGSEVFICFYTNGDFYVPAETRLREALSVARDMGVPESNVVFLGYGDNMSAGMHIYNQPEAVCLESPRGRSTTYALEEHPPFGSSEYRRENIVSDLRRLVLELLPDTVFCVDFDPHPDHAALSLFFDEAMESILKRENNSYFPILLKSPCYSTAFNADFDFHAPNLRSTVPPPTDYYPQRFDWDKRVRFPVNPDGLSRSIYDCDTFRHLNLHASQDAPMKAEGVINGDKVFWLRETNSLSYQAKFSASSGSVAYLNDFKTADIPDVENKPMDLGNCAWIPHKDDDEKTVTVTLEKESSIDHLRLYPNPAGDSRVLNALISFDDGSRVESGELNRHGGSLVHVGKANVKSFSVRLVSTEGEGAGLSEIEIFEHREECPFNFIKLQNMQGDFIYDYYIQPKGERFSVYSPCSPSGFRISVDNSRCSANLNGGIITVDCPKGQSCTLSVKTEDGKYSDSAFISNPGNFMRYIAPTLEKCFRGFRHCNIRCSSTYRILHRAYEKIR